MKIIIFTMSVLMLAVPAWATVTITATQVGDTNEVAITYDVNAPDGRVRGFPLKITVDNEANIVAISPAKKGESTAAEPGYGIFPGSFALYITVLPDGTVEDWNAAGYSPLADPCDPDNPPELPSPYIIVELGSLYDDEPNAPNDVEGTLFTITVDVDGDCNVCPEEENVYRGGIVMEDLENPDALDFVCGEVVILEECFYVGMVDGCGHTIDQDDVNEWVAQGEPESWCYPCHCRGDINGDCFIDAFDLQGTDGQGGVLDGWVDAWLTAYDADCDTNYDGSIDAADLQGVDGQGGVLDCWVDGWFSGGCAGIPGCP